MGAYGVHPTRYGNLSNDQLYAMFRESTYSKLEEREKLDLLQETVNRDALEKGEVGAPEVRFADLPANESGNAANGVINVNRDMAVNGTQSFEYNGQTIQHSISAYNIQSLNTVLHENIHCFQDQIIDGTITIEDAQKTAEYQANSFTSSAVLQNGRYQLGSQYLTGETANGYYCYYFQSTERDAFLGAEERTAAILSGLTEKYGTEPSFEAYAKSVESTGYHATEREDRLSIIEICHLGGSNLVVDDYIDTEQGRAGIFRIIVTQRHESLATRSCALVSLRHVTESERIVVETEFIGTQQGANDDITARFDLPVNLQNDPLSQVVDHERLLRL